jgi:threonine synthase
MDVKKWGMIKMKYVSTRSSRSEQADGKKSAARAIIKGIAEDRGLFVPEIMPRMLDKPSELKGLNYNEVAYQVLSRYLTDYTETELRQCINSAYDQKFEAAEIAPLIKAGDVYFLELFHGRTAAFKDMALSMLPHLLTTALKKENEADRIAILTATSGDTGKAALEGFAGVKNTEIIVFYPHVGVSQVQQRQMTTQEGDNTHVFGIRGNFDDAQAAVKTIFNDTSLAAVLKEKGWQLSSANSINIGRLVPQVVYYVWAYVKLLERGTLLPGELMNVVVPTGNFGNILAAFYARELGIPVGKFICASNRNKVLTEFINTGVYDIRREFHITSSPSMDILVSSNLERLLYHLAGSDGKQVAGLMKALEEEKHYKAGDDIRVGLTDFYAGFADEEETSEAIRIMHQDHRYLMDPHTAVGYKVYADYRNATGDETPTVIAATASAYKFADSVAAAIGLPKSADGFEAIQTLHKATGIRIPSGLKGLEKRAIRHHEVLRKDEIADAVMQSLR